MNDLIPMNDLREMAGAVAKSGLFGIKDPVQALALMLVAQAEGSHPATVARDYHIIDGRPALKADAMLSRYISSGGKVEWHDHTDTKVSATFSHPSGGSLTIDWDMDRAKKAGLGGKAMWSKYPRQMLRARVISEGIRATNPGVAVGIYTPEEVQDFEPARKEKDMGSATVLTEQPDTPVTESAPPSKVTPTAGAWDAMEPDMQTHLSDLATEAKGMMANGKFFNAVAHINAANLATEEKVALWTRFDSRERSALKSAAEEMKKTEAAA